MWVREAASIYEDETQDEQRSTDANGKDGVGTESECGCECNLRPLSRCMHLLSNPAVVHGQTFLLAVELMTAAGVDLCQVVSASLDVLGSVGIWLETELFRECAAHGGWVWW